MLCGAGMANGVRRPFDGERRRWLTYSITETRSGSDRVELRAETDCKIHFVLAGRRAELGLDAEAAADVAVITKTDLAAAVGFDRELLLRNIEQVRPGLEVLAVSARTGDG